MPIRILIAPSGFKESLGAEEVANCIESGILSAFPDAVISKVPLADGGEGFTSALIAATDGEMRHIGVTGPTGQPVQANYGFLGGRETKTAVLEMASAAGLRTCCAKRSQPFPNDHLRCGRADQSGAGCRRPKAFNRMRGFREGAHPAV